MVLTDNLAEAQKLVRGTLRVLQMHNILGVTEMTLANGRRADILAIGPKGDVTIIEIKSSPADFRSDHKWPEYGDYCDRFYFAVGQAFPQALIPPSAGLIVADAFGGAIIRESKLTKLSAARRKAVTLKFARLTAQRLLMQKPD